MSDTNRVGLFGIDEVTWGTVPGSALTELRKTGMNFRPLIVTAESEEIIDDAQLQGLILVDEAGEFDFPGHLSYGSYDAELQALMRTTWPVTPVALTASTISAAAGDNSFNDSANGLLTAGFVAGQIVKSTVAGNLGYFVVVSVTAGKMVVSGGTLTTQAAGASYTLKGTPISNGTTLRSRAYEEKWVNSGGTSHFMSYPGARLGGFSLELVPGSIANLTFSGLCKRAVPAAATVGTGAPTAATTTEIMNGVGNVKLLVENGTAISLTRLRIGANNNLRRRSALGMLGATGINQGEFRVDGQISAYCEDRTLLEKAINQTASSLAWVVEDAAGNAYGFHIPALKYGQPDKPVSGKSQDLMLTLPLTGYKHATLLKTLYVTRIPA